MDITVKCACGSNYSFTETPENGQVRYPVTCPNCGADGTADANEYIRKAESGELAREQEQARRRSGSLFGRVFSGGGNSAPRAATATVASGSRFIFGVIGACIGGALGMAIWYFVTLWTHYEIGYVAWAVGALAGLGARLAMGSGSFGLAGFAALVAFAAIMGGQYMLLRERVVTNIEAASGYVYDGMTIYAKEAVKYSTSVEVRVLLAKNGYREDDLAAGENAVLCKKRLLPLFNIFFGSVMKEGSSPTFGERIKQVRARTTPSDADVASFMTREQPQLQDFLQGKPSKEEFDKSLAHMVGDTLSFNNLMVQSWSPYQLLWLVLGVGTAYRLAYNRSETESL